MARQRGPLQLTGSIGNLSFYYHKEYGYLARLKGGAPPGKLSPRTKENGDELGAASRAGKLIRYGVRAALQLEGDSTVSQRLTGCLYRVLRCDAVNARGRRTVADGLQTAAGRQLLRSFAFDRNNPLERMLKAFRQCPDEATVAWQGLVPRRDLSCPAGATHVVLQAAVVIADPGNDAYTVFASAAQVLPLDGAPHMIALSCGVIPEAGQPPGAFRVTALRVSFLAESDGEMKVVSSVVGVL